MVFGQFNMILFLEITNYLPAARSDDPFRITHYFALLKNSVSADRRINGFVLI